MHFLLDYILKLSVSLAVVFLFYYFILRKLTFYNHNRWYLLGYTMLSFFIPFINVSALLQKNNWHSSEIVNWVPAINNNVVADLPVAHAAALNIRELVLLIIIAGMLVMLTRLLLQFFSFKKMLRKAEPVSSEGMNLYQVNDNIIPFSFGNSIFINRHLHTKEELQEIIHHEFVHVKQRHSIDIIWSELLCIACWYNPFVWLLKKSIRQNLEFIADGKVLENGINKKEYQYLLLKVIGNNQYSIATQFNFSSLKKRIAMMNKTKSAKRQLIRLLFLLPATAVLLLAFRSKWNAAAKTTTADKTVAITGFAADAKILQPYTAYGEQTMPKDTFPKRKQANSKGYLIDVADKKGNCTLVIKDKAGKEVKRVLLTEWNDNAEKYEGTYGELPPPPPPPAPPAPPVPPVAIGVKVAPDAPVPPVAIGVQVTPAIAPAPPEPPVAIGVEVTPAIAPPPPPPPPPPPAAPPAPPAPPKLPANVKRLDIDNNKATIWLKNGQKETYDFNNAEQKEKFEKKYGEITKPPTPPDATAVPYKNNVTVYTGAIKVMNSSKLLVLDGKELATNNTILTGKFTMLTLAEDAAEKKYGAKGANGAIEIITQQ